MAPERAAATDQVLPQARLRLVDAGGGAAVERCSRDVAAHALLVHGVARLVDGPEQALVEEVARDAGRDANVVRSES